MSAKSIFITIVTLCSLSHLVAAQSPAIWTFYHNTPRSDISFKATVPGFLVKSSALFVEDKAARQLLKRIGKTRILVAEDQADFMSRKETKRFVRRLHRDGFEDFLAVKDGDENVNFMIRQRHNRTKGLVMLVKDRQDFVLISMRCNLREGDLIKLINEHGKDIRKNAKKKSHSIHVNY